MHSVNSVPLLCCCREPVRSFISDCYSFCRFSVLAPEQPPSSEHGEPQAGGSSGGQQQSEQAQQQADEFVAAVLADDAEPAASGGAPAGATTLAVASASAEPTGEADANSQPALQDGTAVSPAAGSWSAAEAIWGLHPCPRASAEQPPALLALPGGDERTAQIVCCACGASLAAFREEAAGRKLGMLMAVQLYCLPPAAARASSGAGEGGAAAAAGSSGPAGCGGIGGSGSRNGSSDSRNGSSSSNKLTAADTAVKAGQPPRVCLAAGYEDGSLVLWDAAAPGAPLAQRQLCKEPIMALALHPCPCNPTGGACGSAEDAIVAFKLDHSAHPARISVRHEIELRKQGIGDAVVRPDGKLLVTAGWDGRVRVYKYRIGRALAILKVGACLVWVGCWAPAI